MVKNLGKSFRSGTVKKSVTINVSKQKVWKEISNIVGLPLWLVDVRETIFLSKKKRGVGAIRLIIFNDRKTIEEHVVDWKNEECFTYIATEGLPLRAYVATLKINPKSKNTSILTWQSYFNSKKMTKKEFLDFQKTLEQFYESSLKNLKKRLEKKSNKM